MTVIAPISIGIFVMTLFTILSYTYRINNLRISKIELEEKLQLRDEEVEDKKEEIALNIGCDENDSFLNLKTDFIRCKVINLDDNNLDKLSKKYNLSMDYLFNLKKSNNKLIVYDKD